MVVIMESYFLKELTQLEGRQFFTLAFLKMEASL